MLRLSLNEPVGGEGPADMLYPDPAGLTKDLAELHGVNAGNIIVCAGADQGLDVCCRAAQPGEAVFGQVEFPRYETHARNAALTVVAVPNAQRPFTFPSRSFVQAIGPRTTLVIVPGIGTPLGVRRDDSVIEQIRDRTPHSLVVLDDVYDVFMDHNFASYAARTPGVVSIFSFSKRGIPGARVGYMVAHEVTAHQLRRFVSGFAVAALSLESARRSIHNRVAWSTLAERQTRARILLASELKKRGLDVVESAANWVLLRIGVSAADIAGALAQRGVLIQLVPHESMRGWIRISTPDSYSVQRFLQVFDAVLDMMSEKTGQVVSTWP
jgi:histidinol-phosphate aminotransferase